MPSDVAQWFAEARKGQFERFARTINPQLVKVLRTIGFDRTYVRAQGAYLFDAEGHRYLDCLSGYGVFNMGRNHPTIKAALQQALDLDLPNMVQMDAPALAGLLAEKLLARVNARPTGGAPLFHSPTHPPPRPSGSPARATLPTGPSEHSEREGEAPVALPLEGATRAPIIDTVFFTNSGTEAVEAALKFAKCATGRARIVHCQNGFHGLTNGALSCNGNAEFRAGFEPLLPECRAVPFGDLPALAQALQGNAVAAFLVEPIQGKGVSCTPSAYFDEAVRLCRRHGTLVIADEVQTGFGRTGCWFACHHWQERPDMLCVAKALSGGFVPVGALCYPRWVNRKVYSSMERCVVHSNTFGRNTLAMVAGLAALQVLEEGGLVENAARQGAVLRAGMVQLAEEFEMVREVRGEGLMLGMEFGEPKSLALRAGWKLIHSMHKGLFGQLVVVPLLTNHRILSQVAGHNTILKLLPPLVISDDDVRWLLDALRTVVAEVHKFPGAAWEVGRGLAARAARA